MLTAPLTDALIDTSGVPRWSPTTLLTSFWNDGRENASERPPLPAQGGPQTGTVSFQTWSGAVRLPSLLSCSSSPPTAVTSGSVEGQSTTR